RLRPAASTRSLAYRPVTPAPSMEGVLGIARTTATSPPSQRSICPEVMPAATDTASGRAACAASASSRHTPGMTWGLTANIHTGAPCTASIADANVATPKSRSSASRVDWLGATTRMSPGAVPRPMRPPIRLRAMLPPPMKAIFPAEAGSWRGEVIGCSSVGGAAHGMGGAGPAPGRRWPEAGPGGVNPWHRSPGTRAGAGSVTHVGGYTAGGEYAWATPGAAARARNITGVQGTRMDIAEL